MKQLVAMLLIFCLMLPGLALPAGAAELQDELGRITLLAKSQLDIGDSYTKFSGYPREGLSRTWSLSWSSADASASAQLTDEGLVLSYRLSRNADYIVERSYAYAPALPSLTNEKVLEIAKAYANKLLGDRESADLSLSNGNYLNSGSRYCYGFVLVDGLPTSMNLSVTVGQDGVVTSYSRSNPADKYLKDAPASAASATAAQAHATLAEKLALKLEYVMGDEGVAVLRFIPVWGDEYIVDAATGKLVNLTELYNGVFDYYRGGDEKSAAPAAEDSANSLAGGLTETEIAGTEKLKGALDSAAMDAKLAAIPELGLSNYTLSRTDYYFASEDKLTATLRYTLKGSTEDYVARKYVTVDAMTGELMSLYSSRTYEDDKAPDYSAAKAKTTAEGFLTRLFAAGFAKTALYSGGDALSYVYAQKEQGYFYPANKYSVDIDPVDGSIANFYYSFDDSVQFETAENLITEAQAHSAYAAVFEARLQYIDIPKYLDPAAPEFKPYIEYGYTYLYEMLLGYRLEADRSPIGVAAKTGEVLYAPVTAESPITYDDAGGFLQLELLAGYGVGFKGGKLRPYEALTQRDMLQLFASAVGWNAGTDDELYSFAQSYGFLTASERTPDATVTRGDLIRCLLRAAGYQKSAELVGIWNPGFSDEIPQAYVGYAAIARGLGLVKGGSDGKFAATRTANRAEAGIILYAFMGGK
ncbi:MAG TPA: YcdB/YcdC domain-containing protein [Candidatus Acidoferrum sp.]|nr:YcdB/YcdC domain-containing protein [Candidatus Acidoferrum sp.]